MKGGQPKLTDPAADVGNVGAEDLSSNQQATPVPYARGEFKVALHWVSPTANQFTRSAPDERPGKK